KWAGVAVFFFVVGELAWGFGPLLWKYWRYGDPTLNSVSFSSVAPEGDTPKGPPDEAWRRFIAGLPPERQARAIGAKLKELNPGFGGSITRMTAEKDKIVSFEIATEETADLRPLAALTFVRRLVCSGGANDDGRLADLTPLNNLPLEELVVNGNPALVD